MSGTIKIPKYYEDRELPPGYLENDIEKIRSVKSNVNMKEFAKFLRETGKDALEITWDEIKQFRINPEINNVWY